jgi:hypothetical protein
MGGEVASLLDSLASNWDGYLETGGQDGTTNTANTTNVTTVNNTQTTTSIDEDNHHPFNSNGSNALFTSGTGGYSVQSCRRPAHSSQLTGAALFQEYGTMVLLQPLAHKLFL